MHNHPTPGPDLVKRVRAGFVLQGTTLGRWCRDNKVMPQHARLALLGGWNGPKGTALRERLMAASGLITEALPHRRVA